MPLLPGRCPASRHSGMPSMDAMEFNSRDAWQPLSRGSRQAKRAA